MKQKYIVTINADEHEGKQAEIVAYDQETGDWDIYNQMKDNKRLVESIERSVEKVLYSYAYNH